MKLKPCKCTYCSAVRYPYAHSDTFLSSKYAKRNYRLHQSRCDSLLEWDGARYVLNKIYNTTPPTKREEEV